MSKVNYRLVQRGHHNIQTPISPSKRVLSFSEQRYVNFVTLYKVSDDITVVITEIIITHLKNVHNFKHMRW